MQELLASRSGDWLTTCGHPRLTVLLFAIVFYAVFFSAAFYLSSVGMESYGLIAALSFTMGYAALLFIEGLWLVHFKTIDAKELSAESESRTFKPGEAEFDKHMNHAVDDIIKHLHSEGSFAFCVGTIVLGIIFITAHCLYHAPWYLGELLVNGGKIRHRTCVSGTLWTCFLVPLKQSWIVAAFLLIQSSIAGFLIDTAS